MLPYLHCVVKILLLLDGGFGRSGDSVDTVEPFDGPRNESDGRVHSH